MKSALSILAYMIVLSTHMPLSHAGQETGGGDEYTADFVATASQAIYPWIKAHGSSLHPNVSATAFLLAINPDKVLSADHIFESCDGTRTGREVDACYNSETGQTQISRARYPLNAPNTPAKLRLIAHEIFRKMGIEGDQYEITKQIPILNIASEKPPLQSGMFSGRDSQLNGVSIDLQYSSAGIAVSSGDNCAGFYQATSDPTLFRGPAILSCMLRIVDSGTVVWSYNWVFNTGVHMNAVLRRVNNAQKQNNDGGSCPPSVCYPTVIGVRQQMVSQLR